MAALAAAAPAPATSKIGIAAGSAGVTNASSNEQASSLAEETEEELEAEELEAEELEAEELAVEEGSSDEVASSEYRKAAAARAARASASGAVNSAVNSAEASAALEQLAMESQHAGGDAPSRHGRSVQAWGSGPTSIADSVAAKSVATRAESHRQREGRGERAHDTSAICASAAASAGGDTPQQSPQQSKLASVASKAVSRSSPPPAAPPPAAPPPATPPPAAKPAPQRQAPPIPRPPALDAASELAQSAALLADSNLAQAAAPAKAAVFVTRESLTPQLLHDSLVMSAQVACGGEARVKLGGKKRNHVAMHAVDEVRGAPLLECATAVLCAAPLFCALHRCSVRCTAVLCAAPLCCARLRYALSRRRRPLAHADCVGARAGHRARTDEHA